MRTTRFEPICEDDAEFWEDDTLGEEAAGRIRDQLDSGSVELAVPAGSDKLRFQCSSRLLRDTVAVAAARGKADEKDTLQFAVDANSMVAHAQFRNLKTWVEVSHGKSQNEDARLCYRMPSAIWERLAAWLEFEDCVHFQIELPRRDQSAGVLKVAVKDFRGRLSVAGELPVPSSRPACDKQPLTFRPQILSQALRQIAAILSAAPNPGGIVSAANGMVFAGGQDAVITVTDPSLANVHFKIGHRDALPLARVVGRMRPGRAFFHALDDEYLFFDEVITCSVKQASGTPTPIEKIIDKQISRRLALLPAEVGLAAIKANIIKPARVAFKWTSSFPTRLALEAHTPRSGRLDGRYTDVLNLHQESVEPASDLHTQIDGRLWFAAIDCMGWNPSSTQWHILGRDQVMRMVTAKDDRVTSIYLPFIQ
jgi:hypothetical protein